MKDKNKIKEVLFEKIRFINGDYQTVKKEFLKGGVMVVPAAPALKNIHQDKLYYEALKNSSFAILDSGYFCLLLRIIKNIKVVRFSGLEFLREFFKDEDSIKKTNEDHLVKVEIEKPTTQAEMNLEFRICPTCRSKSLKTENGCDVCIECGYSKCDK